MSSTNQATNAPAYATHWRQAVMSASGLAGVSRAVLRDAVLSLSAALNTKVGDRFLRCLYCHYVFDDQLEDFDRMIAAVKEIGSFVDTDTCMRMLRGEQAIDGRYFHLSFDDGFKNNFTNAIPILKRHDVPAIFFIPSALIDGGWETARKYCLETTQYTGVIEVMTWDDVNDLLAQGFEIGSHTKTHARFSEISSDRARMEDEILGSKIDLEKKLGIDCRYISWPFGKITDADPTSLQMVRDAGYTACFGAYRGTVRPGETDPFSIPRHHFEAQWPVSHVKYFARGNREG